MYERRIQSLADMFMTGERERSRQLRETPFTIITGDARVIHIGKEGKEPVSESGSIEIFSKEALSNT